MIRLLLCSLCTILACTLSANEAKPPLQDNLVETPHQISLDGKMISYKTITGTMVVRDDDNKDKATIFFIAYVKDGTEDYHDRPVMFCFNGGPGSSSVWLHLGAFGPRIVDIDGVKFDSPPYDLLDNPESLLAVTDLVFIDPVSTGYSRAAPEVDEKEFHGVDEDITSIGSFIRLWTTRYGRWESPKFLAGESYGSTRAARLAGHVHDQYGMYVNGVVLISCVLNFQTLRDDSKGNDLPYVLFFPTYTATAWYHKRLGEDLQSKSLEEVMAEAEHFALHDYATALILGDLLDPAERKQVITKMSQLTGLSEEYIERANLRVAQSHFAIELLKDQNKTIGRFDGRFVGDSLDAQSDAAEYDPSKDAVFGAFTASFYQYVTRELGWKSDLDYRVLANVWPWSFNGANNTYLNVGPDLREVMIKNPKLKVLVANGYYDLATTYFANIYTFNHFYLPTNLRNNLSLTFYPSGHMMYIEKDSLKKLNQDIKQFILTND